MSDLPKFKRGEAWFVPDGDWLDDGKDWEPRRVSFRLRETFEVRPPKVGEARREAKVLAAVDLARIREAMDEEAEDEAPAADGAVERVEVRVEVPVPVFTEAQLEEIRKLGVEFGMALKPAIELVRPVTERLDNLIADYAKNLQTLMMGESIDLKPWTALSEKFRGQPNQVDEVRVRHGAAERGTARQTAASGDKLPGGEQRILDALAMRYPKASSRRQIAILAGYSAKSSGFQNYLSALRTKGLIETVERGFESLTAAGKARVTQGVRAPTGAGSRITMWLSKVSGGEAKVLRALIDAYPKTLDRPTLAERSGYSEQSSGFQNYISSLKTAGLVDVGKGTVRAASELFE
jgi:hypothetical protein